MSLKPLHQRSFADLCVEKRKDKGTFFSQINTVIDWSPIQALLSMHYPKGMRAAGKRAYDPLLLFKMLLLQTWYGLSDYAVEEEVNDRITFSRFCGLSLEDSVPDHSVVSRFRTALTKAKAFDLLFEEINKQLTAHQVMIRHGSAAVDASITVTPRKPKGKKSYEVAEDGSLQVAPSYAKGVDQEASWTKKGGVLYYGYKRHVAVDSKEGWVLAVTTTEASASDSIHLAPLLDKLSLAEKSRIYADKGYAGAPNAALLDAKKLKNGIQKKATRHHPLSAHAKKFNTLVSKIRYKVERVFGSIKRWFKTSKARYIGLANMHTQHVMEAIAYNLYRTPNIILRGF